MYSVFGTAQNYNGLLLKLVNVIEQLLNCSIFKLQEHFLG